MKSIRNMLLRTVYRAGHPLARAYWRAAQPRRRGVKCVLTRGREVLLVRHTYGSATRWELPGGGVKRGEEPHDAARREAREELGLDIDDWRLLGDLFERIDGKRDTLWCYTAAVEGRAIVTDGAEIAEARWFGRDALPADVHRYIGRILALG
ncbi:MAG TPA: NUDIX domain-containing protein [Thermoleophilaceae bacterium]